MSGMQSLHVILTPDQIEEIAARVARRILEGSLGDTYDQSHLPPGFTRRTYLEAARAGRFPSRKVGKVVVARRSDVDAWIASRPSATRASKRQTQPDLDEEVVQIAEQNGARVRR